MHISTSLSLNQAAQKSTLWLAIVSNEWFLLRLHYPSAPGVGFYEALTPIGSGTVYQVAANFMEDHSALQLALRHLHDGSLALTPEQRRNLLVYRQSCTARQYLRIIYSVPKVHRQITNMHPVWRDCDLTLYFPCWQKSGSETKREKGVGSNNTLELHTVKEVCDLIQDPHSVPNPSAIQHTEFADTEFTEL